MKRGLIACMASLALASCSGNTASDAPQALDITPAAFDAGELSQTLAEAIRFRTISAPGFEAESADDFDAFRAFLAERFPLIHARLEHTELGAHSVIFTWRGSDASLAPVIFLAHQDVVPIEPGTEDRWTYPAFDGVIAEGQVWGRGTMDMKGHLITLLSAVERHLAEGTEPARTVYLVLGADEEVGGAGARAAAQYIAETGQRAWFTLDEGGFTIMENPVSGTPAAMIAVAEKGYMTVEITARARGGHSSTPPEHTSVGLLARALVQIEDAPFDHGLDGGPTRAMITALAPQATGLAGFAMSHPGLFGPIMTARFMADDASRALLGTTIAPTIVQGGIKDNVLPQESRALVNLRLHPRDTINSALAHLRASVADLDGVTIEPWGAINNAPPVAATEGPAWDLIAGAALAFAPEGTPAVPMMLTATTDARAFADVSENLYRYAPVRAAMEDVARIHGDDERIAVEDLERMAAFFHAVIGAAVRADADQ